MQTNQKMLTFVHMAKGYLPEMSAENNPKSETANRPRSSSDNTALGESGNTDKNPSISREQRSEAAKRGWITRKKRKP